MQAIQLRNRIECHTNRVREQVQTSDLPSTKEGLHLGPHLLNGIQIGTVGRKVQNFHPLFLQDLPDSFYMVRAHNFVATGDKVKSVRCSCRFMASSFIL